MFFPNRSPIRLISCKLELSTAPACSSHLTKHHQALESTWGRPIWPHRSSTPGSRAPMAMPSCLHDGGDSVAAQLAQHRAPLSPLLFCFCRHENTGKTASRRAQCTRPCSLFAMADPGTPRSTPPLHCTPRRVAAPRRPPAHLRPPDSLRHPLPSPKPRMNSDHREPSFGLK